MEQGNDGGEEDGGGDISASQDGSTCSATTRDLRLDDWILYQHDQLLRNADILKDDLETIRKHCMVPDLPKLVKENKRSVKLSTSIVHQFQGVIQKHIHVMEKLSFDMSSELYDRFNNGGAETSFLAVLPPPVLPCSSTEPDPDPAGQSVVTETKPEPEPSVSGTQTPLDEILGMSPILGRRKSTRPDVTPVKPVNDTTSSGVPGLGVAEIETGLGNESDCSDSSVASGTTVLMQRTTTQQMAKKAFSPVEVKTEKEDKDKEKNKKPKKQHVPTIDEMLDMELPDFSLNKTSTPTTPPTGTDEDGGAGNGPADESVNTDNEQPAENPPVPDLLRCPKLTQITKVFLHRLPSKTLEKLGKKEPIVSKELDELDKAMRRLLKYNPILKPAVNGKKRKANEERQPPAKNNTEDSDQAAELSGGSQSSCSDSEDNGEMSSPTIPRPMGAEGYDSEDFSEMDDLSDGGEAEAVGGNGTKGNKKETTGNEAKKSNKKYITPKLVFSSEDEDLLGLDASKAKVKKEKNGSDAEKISLRSKKKSMPADETDDKPTEDEESDTDTGVQNRKKNKGKKNAHDGSDSDSDFTHFKSARLKNLLEKNKHVVKKYVISDDSDDSDSKSSANAKRAPFKRRKEPKTDEESCSESDKKTKKRVLSSASESDSSTKKTRKRRRIKKENLSGSDANDSDVMIVETEKEKTPDPSPKKGMRKVMSKKELQKTTRQAGKEEEDRKKRVVENQKLYNQLFSAQLEKGERLTELVLDFDKTTKKPLLSVDPSIVKELKPHQVEGIKFMWDTCYESLESIKAKENGGGGCILAHCMGLGKTLQTIGFLHTVMGSEACKTKYALVICPLNTVGNWYNEFQQWCSDCDVRPRIHKLWDAKGKRRFEALSDWQRLGGVGIIHYESFRMLASIDEKKKGRPTQKELKIVETTLLKPGPDIVVCDEGHLLKNASTKQAQAVMKIRTPRRVVLTGTPLQNDLMEYHTMMSFVKPNLLGTKKEFRNRFVNPIERGQNKNSDAGAVSMMKRRAHVLHKLLDGCVQRLDYSVLTPYLPPKYEYSISINLSQVQKDLYQLYLDNVSSKSTGNQLQLLPDYMALVKVWTHPVVLTYKRRNRLSSDSETGSLKDFICDETTTDSEVTEVEADSDVEIIEKKKEGPKEGDVSGPPSPAGDWFSSILKSQDDLDKNIELSGKILVLFEILKTCALIEDKVLVFSQFLTSLDLIESFLAQLDDEAQQKAKDEPISFPPTTNSSVGRWRPNIEYYRIDGSTKTEDRQKSCKIFNQEKTTRAKLFLISTKAGGLGINLTGANRVVMFDASWNPSHDIQSIFRVYRFGQTKPCYIYRLLARGTMEEKIYNRQVVKLSLSCRVVDEQQIERHFHYDEVQAMYTFNPNDTTERPIPAVPKDRLLADLLISHENWIFSYLEHDSLLENKEEETLTEEERKAAWEEYNNEEKPKLSYGLDAWTAAIIGILKSRYPEKSDVEIFQITQKIRQEFDFMHRLVAAMQGATEIQKTQLDNALTAKAAELKTIFGNDTDWTTIFQKGPSQQVNHQPPPPPQPSQPKFQQQRKQSFPGPSNQVGYLNYPIYPSQQQQQQQATSSASLNAVRDRVIPPYPDYEVAKRVAAAAALKKFQQQANQQRQTNIFPPNYKFPGYSGSQSQNSGAGIPPSRMYAPMGQDRNSIAYHNGEPLNNARQQQRPSQASATVTSGQFQQRPVPALNPVMEDARPTHSGESESILPDIVDLD